MRTAIVLAGGRSARFEGQKLAADVDGRTLLAATISAFASIVDGLIVAGPRLPPDWRRVWDDASPIALVGDLEPYGGPLAALANVLRQAAPDRDDLAIVVGGDMPALVPDVLGTMFDRLEAATSIDALILGRPDSGSTPDAPRPVLPIALRVGPAAEAADAALEEGRRSLPALLDRLRWLELPASDWLPLDPRASTLLDVDTRADIERIRAGKGR